MPYVGRAKCKPEVKQSFFGSFDNDRIYIKYNYTTTRRWSNIFFLRHIDVRVTQPQVSDHILYNVFMLFCSRYQTQRSNKVSSVFFLKYWQFFEDMNRILNRKSRETLSGCQRCSKDCGGHWRASSSAQYCKVLHVQNWQPTILFRVV